ncbi:MAG: flavodoxin-dependent (E)-4-hydroxy-3-methylbut-2-enyl-diphosphate synthase [Spirochaetales bacterium]|nr:MAG: flavodoxin-dependent (E)-4-hydroxy-3-methylbut-2-enyl-diphosphate synthase [Spirochaetales bacterium]
MIVTRAHTKKVLAGTLALGGSDYISIQTMWKKPLTAVTPELLTGIEHLRQLGCELLRFAVPDIGTSEIFGALCSRTSMPLVADIHFDYRIALRVLDFPVAKLRINPGNIGAPWKVEEVVRKAKDKNVPIRIGVNHGSLPKNLSGEKNHSLAMVWAAEMEMEILHSLDFQNAVFSLKSSDLRTTVNANLLFAEKYDYPLHVGVTEAGPLIPGIVKNTLALNSLLSIGIGNTIRISLSDSEEHEIITCREVLGALGLRGGGITIVSCPKCGRTGFDTGEFLREISEDLYRLPGPLKVAIMGCAVNGPGEAKDADAGITGAGDKVILFKRGEIVKTTDRKNAREEFLSLLKEL